MPSNELETIAASIQDALHRAYAMGRNDALRRVVEMVQEDELGSKTVALLGHSEPPPAETPHPDQERESPPIPLPHAEAEGDLPTPGDTTRRDNAEHAEATRREERAPVPPVSTVGFLKDFFYPLGGKK